MMNMMPSQSVSPLWQYMAQNKGFLLYTAVPFPELRKKGTFATTIQKKINIHDIRNDLFWRYGPRKRI